MNNINFDNPWLLILGLPLILVSVIPFIIAVKKENKTKNNIISFLIHLIISILLTFTFAHTTYEYVITETNIYVLADVSYSSNQNLDKIDEYINNLEGNVPKNSKIGIVCFGKDYEELVSPGEELISVKNSTVDVSSTNITEALEYTATLFRDDVIKRIVIISDGEETKESNIVSVVNMLSNDGIYIDAIYLDNNLSEDTKEVQINQVEYTTSVYQGDEEIVQVLIQSNYKARAICKLYKNGNVIDEEAITTSIGFNTVTFNLDTSSDGIHSYEVKIECSDDTSNHNNTNSFNQKVTKETKVLFVSENTQDSELIKNIYGDKYSIDYYVNNPLVPFTVEELSKYDEYILSNVDVRNLYNHSQFVSSIGLLVSEFGKSLLTFGNTYIQNNEENETLQALSDMLPVKFGNNEYDDKLITIVFDMSRSMELAYKEIIAKKAACTILDNLDDEVLVAMIGFYGESKTIFLPTKAKEREKLKEQINKLEVYQGTFLGSALEYTYDFVTDLHYSKNEVILISDGRPYLEQEAASVNYVKKLASANVVTSCIHVVTNEGTTLMKELAEVGKGTYDYILEEKDVESIILDGVLNELKEVVLDKNESQVLIVTPNDSLLDGVTNIPNVKGLYNNSSKTDSTVVLNALYKDITDKEYTVPLYTYWNYGKGKVSSFASSISGEWATYWLNSSECSKFIENVIPVNRPTERTDSGFIINSETKGTLTTLNVTVPSLNTNSKVIANIKYPDGRLLEKELIFDSQSYVCEIDTNVVGLYELTISYSLGELLYSTDYSINISYLPEYNSFTVFEASNLYYMVSSNGQISEDGVLVLENDASRIQMYIIDFTPIFMTICVVLYLIDVIIRKLRWQDVVSLFKKVKKDINN